MQYSAVQIKIQAIFFLKNYALTIVPAFKTKLKLLLGLTQVTAASKLEL